MYQTNPHIMRHSPWIRRTFSQPCTGTGVQHRVRPNGGWRCLIDERAWSSLPGSRGWGVHEIETIEESCSRGDLGHRYPGATDLTFLAWHRTGAVVAL